MNQYDIVEIGFGKHSSFDFMVIQKTDLKVSLLPISQCCHEILEIPISRIKKRESGKYLIFSNNPKLKAIFNKLT